MKSPLGFKARVGSTLFELSRGVCVTLHIPWDSPLVRHLQTSWWSAWQPSRLFHIIVQGFIRPVAHVGSGDPVRVLCLYTTITLDEVCSIYCWDICTTCRYWSMCYSTCAPGPTALSVCSLLCPGPDCWLTNWPTDWRLTTDDWRLMTDNWWLTSYCTVRCLLWLLV